MMKLAEIEQWMGKYYLHRQAEPLPMVIESLSKHGKLNSANAIEPIIFFLSTVLRENTDKIERWLAPLMMRLQAFEQKAIITSLWLADTPQTKAYLDKLAEALPELQKYIAALALEPLPDLENAPIDKPGVLDVLWAVFMATGERKFVIRIISALAECDNDSDKMKQLIGNAAKWSLASNAENHPRVKSICLAQLTEQPPKVVALLKEIVTPDGHDL